MEGKEFFEALFSYKNIDGVDLRYSKDLIAYVSSATFKMKGKATESSVIVRQISTKSIVKKFQDPDTNYSGAAFNPSGTKIAMIEKKGKNHFLLIFHLSTQNEERLAVDSEIHAIKWRDDDTLVFLMTVPLPRDQVLRRTHGDDPIAFEKDDPFWSLYRYTPSEGIARIQSDIQVWDFDISGDKVVVIGSSSATESSWYESKLYSIDISNGNRKLLYDPGRRQISRPRISPDRDKVLLLESVLSDRGVYSGDIILLKIDPDTYVNLTDGLDRSYHDIAWGTDGKIYALWNKELNFGVSVLGDAWKIIWQSIGTVSPLGAPEFCLSGEHIGLVFSDALHPEEVLVVSSDHTTDTVSSDNDHLKGSVKTYPFEIVTWNSDDGMEIYGLLRSLGPEKPLVVYVHGGPTSFSSLSFLSRFNMFLDSGFSVFAPNYRGSTGKGRKYAEANVGDLGGMDFRDIISGIRYLESTGRLSSNNLFITGGSYGGFMSAWAVTQTDIFKASVSLFGISDWVSFHGTSSLYTWDRLHMNDDPYSHGLYDKFSPINYVDRVQTPILLMHGEQDKYVPVGQYMQFYRSLRDHGKNVELIIFPREGHGFAEKLHIEANLRKTVEWFRKNMS